MRGAAAVPRSSTRTDLELEVAPGGRFPRNRRTGLPFLYIGLALWSGIAQLSRAEWTELLDECHARGINAIRCSLVEAHFSDRDQFSGENFNGDSPWVGVTPTPFVDALNAAYWNQVEWILEQMAKRGIIMLAHPCYYGNGGGAGAPSDEGWWSGGAQAAGASNMGAFGAALGRILARHPNLIVCVGGDWWLGFEGEPNFEVEDALVAGIKSTDRPGRLYTAHFDPGASSIDRALNWSLDLNHVYSLDAGACLSHTQALSGWSSGTASFFGEGHYFANTSIVLTDKKMRAQSWRAIAYGCFGAEVGDEDAWPCKAATGYNGAKTWAQVMAALRRPHMSHHSQIARILGPRAWQLTAPDSSNAFITGGKGSGDSFVPARASSDLIVAYCPNGATLTGGLSGTHTVKQANPETGDVSIVAGGVSGSGTYEFSRAGDGDCVAIWER